MKKLLCLVGILGLWAAPAFAQQTAPNELPGCIYNATPPTLADKQSIVQQCDTNGQLKISGTINATSAATATAANPSYMEGSSSAFSQDLSGHLRVGATQSGAWSVTLIPSAASGGTTMFTLTLAATTNATNIKASAGQLYGLSGFNMSSATPVWISLYDNAGAPSCGTAIKEQYMIPGNTQGTGVSRDFATPITFASGIAICATTGIAGTGAPAATTYVVNLEYK